MKIFACVILLSSLALAADQKLGAPLSGSGPVSLTSLFAKPDPYVGKTVQVIGKVTEVCEAMGCWMNLTDNDGHLLRIKVDDGVIVFPKDAVGKTAIAEGKLEKSEMTRDQVVAAAQEEAAETGRKFDPSTVKSGKTVYQLAGSGAVILEK